MKTMLDRKLRPVKAILVKLLALTMVLCLLPSAVLAESAGGDWVSFLLICNEGMNNDKGNAGNTMMVVAMQPDTGKIRLMEFTWDTFVDYEGYDVPQKLDMPYRNNGPEEAMKVFNANFNTDLKLFMSLNYLNLANLIDTYNGVDVEITRAERNALNGMVASKKNRLQQEVSTGLLTQQVIDMLADEYYLNEYGPNTHLNGLQAVGFGWLQYDSVYNCCEREVEVIASLFRSVANEIADQIIFYTNETGAPEETENKYPINLDEMTEENMTYLRQLMDPIFQMSYHNVSEEEIRAISTALARAAYEAIRQGVNVFEAIETRVLPLEAEAGAPYTTIAGAKGFEIDKEANSAAIQEFLYHD